MSERRDVAVVLSGGGMNAILMEVGFLQRLRETTLWPRVGWFFGASAGALSGCMASLGRLEQLEEFLLGLQPDETFRPNRLWRLPLLGTHDYVLPRTIAARLDDPVRLAAGLAEVEPELVVIVTDVTLEGGDRNLRHLFEQAYSSRSTPAEVMAQALLASSAISALVLPQPVGDRIATDGGWVRNFPLGYAYERPDVRQIVAFRYEPRFVELGAGVLATTLARLQRYSRLPVARALVDELREAAEREARGEPAHIVDTFSRLSRVAIIRNTLLEELIASWRDQSVEELRLLRADLGRIVREAALGPRERERLQEAIEQRFERARFPFRDDPTITRITVSGSAEAGLEPGFRRGTSWAAELKRDLIDRGYWLTDAQFREQGVV